MDPKAEEVCFLSRKNKVIDQCIWYVCEFRKKTQSRHITLVFWKLEQLKLS